MQNDVKELDFWRGGIRELEPRDQGKVQRARVGIAGLGGLGSNVALSLARLGVGTLILVDHDVVELSNLNRQQYFIRQIGMKKTAALAETLKEVNPFMLVETQDVYLNAGNISSCFAQADIVVEALDQVLAKQELIKTVLSELPEKTLIAASGMAGIDSGNRIQTKQITERFYLVGDDVSEARPGAGIMAPRVSIVANHQAITVLRVILGLADPS